MFLELTDHLRCPEDHDEAYLVLLPDRMENRNVESGEIGCPICHRTWRIVDGVLDFGGAPSAERGPSPLEGGAVAALTGLSGPGGYIVLAGPVAIAWEGVAEALPGVQVVAVNPPAEVLPRPGLSVLRAPILPLKRRSMRAVVLAGRWAGARRQVEAAAQVVLPGLRLVAQGEPPAIGGLEVLATAGGWWVATMRG